MPRLYHLAIAAGCLAVAGNSSLDAQIIGRVSVQSATPNEVTVIRGAPPVSITMEGSNLLLVDIARVLLDGRTARGVHAKLLASRSTTKRSVEVAADAGTTSLSGLQLVLSSSQYRVGASVPVSIRVEPPGTPTYPDLLISRLDVSLPRGSTNLVADIRVTNAGDAPVDVPFATTVKIECYARAWDGSQESLRLSANNDWAYPTFEDAFQGPLAPGDHRDFAWVFPSPASESMPDVAVGCRVDGTAVVSESNESNNSHTVSYPPG